MNEIQRRTALLGLAALFAAAWGPLALAGETLRPRIGSSTGRTATTGAR